MSLHQVWFKNRRAKFRKKQRNLQKEQLQKQKDASGEEGDKGEPAASSTTAARYIGCRDRLIDRQRNSSLNWRDSDGSVSGAGIRMPVDRGPHRSL